jgi:hypothetical protein
MGSAARRGWTTVIALLAAAFAVGWSAAPAAAHEGTVNVAVHTDGGGKVWANVTWTDGHPVDGEITAVMLAVSPGGERVGPLAIRVPDGQNGVLTYEGTLKPGPWRLSIDIAHPGIANCAGDIQAVAPGGVASPQQITCAASFWPEPPAAQAPSDNSSFPAIAVIGIGAVLAAIAAVVFLRMRRDRPGSGGGRKPAPKPRTGAGQARGR